MISMWLIRIGSRLARIDLYNVLNQDALHELANLLLHLH